ncbi:Peroxidase 56 [Zea mays]|uniref:Peroxidase 56 n=2 Tax=Zea mays TaxID=4577 RepID=A0A1D6N9N6_MAIZE|nr:Peroxidase 56 [Zea mays]
MALRRRLLLLVVVVAAAVARCRADDPAVSMLLPGLPVAGLAVGFYNEKCPQAEDLVLAEMRTLVDKDETIGPALLRFMFHDCLVRVRTLPQPAFSSSAYCLIRASWMSFFFCCCCCLARVRRAATRRSCSSRGTGLRRGTPSRATASGATPRSSTSRPSWRTRAR